MKSTFARLLLGALVWGATTAFASEFYIAPNGQDTNPGSSDKPFATLAPRPRMRSRRLKQAGPLGEPVTVWVRGGTYSLPTGVKFDARDSGPPSSAPVTYRAWQNEKPSLVGGSRGHRL